jgi:carbonic anhydrase/acetyltransferase-like protein (isoleucine patch superfamily)
MNKVEKQLEQFLMKQPTLGAGSTSLKGRWFVGDVTIGDYSSVWFNAVLRGDINRIQVGQSHQYSG